MRRHYRGGTKLNKREFVEQEWAAGMLQLQDVEGRSRLGLWMARPGDAHPPLGILWRPELVSCYNDTFSFAGAEQAGGRWCYQVWYCEAHSLPADLSIQLLREAANWVFDPSRELTSENSGHEPS